MLKIIIISLITLILSVILKSKSQEFSLLINIAGGLLILFFVLDYFNEIIAFYLDVGEYIGIDNKIIKASIKIIGVGFLTEFMSNLASDFGNMSIASKVIFGGKVVVCGITLPIVKELILLLFSFY